MALLLVGKAFQDAPVTEMVLPAGAEPDDLVIIGVLAGFSEVDGGGIASGPIPSAGVTDPRFPLIAGVPGGSVELDSAEPNRHFSVWAGTVEDPAAPVTVHVEQGASTFGAFATVELIVLRDDSGASVELDGRGSYSVNLAQDLPLTPPTGSTLPGLSAGEDAGDYAILAIGSYATRLGGLGGLINTAGGLVPRWSPSRSEPVWTPLAPFYGAGSYLGIDFMAVDLSDPPWGDDAGIAPGTVPVWPSPAMGFETGWAAAVLGVRAAAPPVTRQHPRDDGLGFSSGPRIHPTVRGPRGGRIVGGHL